MAWEFIYYNNTVEDEIRSLPPSLLAQYVKLTTTMRDYGPNIGMPHTKALADGLFEIRLKGQEGIARVFYCTVIRYEIIVLHSIIKKEQKIPLRELRLARKRLKEAKKYVQKNS